MSCSPSRHRCWRGKFQGFHAVNNSFQGSGYLLFWPTPYSFQEFIMENYDIYTSTTNREYKEQAERAMKMYYDTFEEIETVRVSPRLQYVKKRLKREKSSNGSRGNGDGKR